MNLTNTHLFDDDHYFIYPKERKSEVSKLPFIEFQAILSTSIKLKNGIMRILDDYHATITVIKLLHAKKC